MFRCLGLARLASSDYECVIFDAIGSHLFGGVQSSKTGLNPVRSAHSFNADVVPTL